MPKANKLSERFVELSEQLNQVLATKKYKSGSYDAGEYVDGQMYTNWKVKALHLLACACGEGSVHYKEFLAREEGGGWSTNYQILLQLQAVFDAAREDFDGGYLASVRTLVQAELFSTELDQARELLNAGYRTPAAVVAGVVLETSLRELCERNGLASGQLNKMNQDLAKANVYNLLAQKRITALADVRNNAAHGHPEEFSEGDVRDMIANVESFLIDHLS